MIRTGLDRFEVCLLARAEQAELSQLAHRDDAWQPGHVTTRVVDAAGHLLVVDGDLRRGSDRVGAARRVPVADERTTVRRRAVRARDRTRRTRSRDDEATEVCFVAQYPRHDDDRRAPDRDQRERAAP